MTADPQSGSASLCPTSGHPHRLMKIKPVHLGMAVAAVLMLALWMSARQRQASLVDALAEPASPMTAPANPKAALAATPEALAYRSRQEFEQETRNFLRDAPKLDDNTRNTRALALSREINRREQNREFSAGEAIMLRVGLIHAAVENESERIRQVQTLVTRYREQSAQRERAFQAQQRRDAQFQQYKAQEARIVSEVLAMQYYPDGMGRDDYLRQRLQEARVTIYGVQAQAPNAATGKP